jgi:hypothetical protein
MEKLRRSSVEVGMTEVRKNFPVDRRISRNPSPEVEENTRSQIPDDGEVVKPAVEDDVPGGSSILYDRWLLKRRRGEVDRWRGLVGGNRISWARRDRRKGWSRDEIRRGGGTGRDLLLTGAAKLAATTEPTRAAAATAKQPR